MKTTIVSTTINVPHLLEDYAKDILESGHKACDFIITGDKKTPPDTASFCAALEKKTGLSVIYYGVQEQNDYMARFPELDNFIPWNCIQRRNISILKAYEQGSDLIITIDDDNFLAQKNYVGGHGVMGKPTDVTAIASKTGWLNICKYLEDVQGRKFYPRGFPVNHRVTETTDDKESKKKGKIVVNGGFWLGDPDIDAVTRLAGPIDVTKYNRTDNFALDIGTWAPFNSQNTAVHRDAIPAYFLCSDIGRFDDIWASYVVKRIADHLGDFITFGFPLVQQKRNPHDYWVDADHERMGMQLTDIFCEWLRTIKLENRTYHSCTLEITAGLKKALDASNLRYTHRAFVNHFIDGYNAWSKTMDRMAALTPERKSA